MATQDKKQPTAQPAEDMFGRPTSPQHSEPATRPAKDAPGQEEDSRSRKGSDPDSDLEDEYTEHHMGGVDDIPDGDGPRSDRGTNPLPESYWADYPGGKP